MTRMNELIERRGRGSVTQFKPELVRQREIEGDVIIAFAKKTKDWPLLLEAVDQKIEHQQEWVAWWDDNVRERGERSNVSDPKHLTVEEVERRYEITKLMTFKWRARLRNLPKYRLRLYGPSYRAAMGKMGPTGDGQFAGQSLSNEYYTPAEYIEAAREVLGRIDLDPASNAIAQQTVQAGAYFTEDDDGLQPDWWGRVWLNPPYGEHTGKFISKMTEELAAGRVPAAICLVNAHSTDTGWFQQLWDGVLCFTDHRINFGGDGTENGSTHGSVFVYFGAERDKFMSVFCQFGACVGPAYVR
jgi:hypothetical protein